MEYDGLITKPSLDELYHHGILGMSWGHRNGPPYPLGSDVSTGKRLKKSESRARKKKDKEIAKRVERANKYLAKRQKKGELPGVKKAREQVMKLSKEEKIKQLNGLKKYLSLQSRLEEVQDKIMDDLYDQHKKTGNADIANVNKALLSREKTINNEIKKLYDSGFDYNKAMMLNDMFIQRNHQQDHNRAVQQHQQFMNQVQQQQAQIHQQFMMHY